MSKVSFRTSDGKRVSFTAGKKKRKHKTSTGSDGESGKAFHINLTWAKSHARNTKASQFVRSYARGWLAGIGASGYRKTKHDNASSYADGKREGQAAARFAHGR